ncbi:hypothetical protein BCR34DRAFT_599956 [Clohesyomyces aquaticus]|uniref:Uncharacterized protein n=1 Tax=Clohesyomyces aquaticus TaxID=1231657 RepID=A0A1Y1ZTQ2_9PLEO|nr:hypothetical protein BCR34DRAFT_599956 [Clohesyomyces aquaticus]
MRYGYGTSGKGDDAVPARLHQIAKDCKRRPLIFMGHSFGGLVVLKTLTDAKGEDRFAEIYRSTIGLVFFGTPFRGTHRDFGGGEDSLSWLLKEAERANASMYSPNYDIFRPGDYSLLNVVDTFNKHTSGDQRPRIMCFTELQPTDIGRWVRVKGQPAQTRCILLVDEHSGALDETADRGKHARNRHHTNVHTFSRANDTDFEVLRIFLTETMEAGPGIIKERGRILRARVMSDANEIAKERDEILRWLSHLANTGGQNLQIARRNRLLQHHHPNTGEWIWQRQEFKDWQSIEATDTTEGRAGAGKSVLVAQVAEKLRPLIAIYCEYDNRERQTRQKLLCCAIRQAFQHILDEEKPIPDELHTIWMKYKSDTGGLPAEEGSSLLAVLVQRLGKCYFVLDGLDEYQGEAKATRSRFPIDIFEDLHTVTTKCSDSCRMLVASRDDVYNAYKGRIDACGIDVVAQRDDIAKYVRCRIEDPNFKHHKSLRADRAASLRKKIVETLCERANGLFLIPSLQLQIIEEKLNLRGVEVSLKQLPTELSELYKLALNRIHKATIDQEDSGLRILELVLCAARCLRLSELQHALATREGDSDFNEDGWIEKETILERTGGLISIDNDDIVLFMHHTVDECLMKEKVLRQYFPDGYVSLEQKCHTYVSFALFRKPSRDITALQRQYPFLRYAAYWLGHHMTKCIEREQMSIDEAFKFLNDRQDMPLASLQVLSSRILSVPSRERMRLLISQSSTLHLAILWDIKPVVNAEVTKRKARETLDFKHQKPLHYAAGCLSIESTEVLLQRNVDVASIDIEGRTALDLILTRPWRDAQLRISDNKLKYFLIKEVKKYMEEAKSQDLKGMNPQEYAIAKLREKRTPVVAKAQAEDPIEKLRRSKRNDVDSENRACLIIHCLALDILDVGEKITIMLIKQNADVNSVDVEDTTPLQLAALYGREELVRGLLKHIANPWVKGLMRHSALQIAQFRAKLIPGNPPFLHIAKILTEKMQWIQREEDKLSSEADKLNLPGLAQAQLITTRKKEAYEKMLQRSGKQLSVGKLEQFSMPGSWDEAW